jgi:curved DNA-binding protein CbpA
MGQQFFNGYFEILRLSPGADQVNIERAYLLLAKRYHHDNKDTGSAKA